MKGGDVDLEVNLDSEESQDGMTVGVVRELEVEHVGVTPEGCRRGGGGEAGRRS